MILPSQLGTAAARSPNGAPCAQDCVNMKTWAHTGAETIAHMHTAASIHISLTFLQRLANFDITVRSLELVEEGADFEFVCDSLPKLRHHGAVFPGVAHLKHGPVAPLKPLW